MRTIGIALIAFGIGGLSGYAAGVYTTVIKVTTQSGRQFECKCKPAIRGKMLYVSYCTATDNRGPWFQECFYRSE